MDISHGSFDAMKEILVQSFNKSMSPILNGIGRDLTGDDISQIYDFSEKKKMWPDSIQNPLRNLSTSTGKNLFQMKRNQAGICTSLLILIKKTRPIN